MWAGTAGRTLLRGRLATVHPGKSSNIWLSRAEQHMYRDVGFHAPLSHGTHPPFDSTRVATHLMCDSSQGCSACKRHRCSIRPRTVQASVCTGRPTRVLVGTAIQYTGALHQQNPPTHLDTHNRVFTLASTGLPHLLVMRTQWSAQCL